VVAFQFCVSFRCIKTANSSRKTGIDLSAVVALRGVEFGKLCRNHSIYCLTITQSQL
jgi:hypothetical protein